MREEKEGNELGKAIVCRLLWRSIWRLCVGERSKRNDLLVQPSDKVRRMTYFATDIP